MPLINYSLFYTISDSGGGFTVPAAVPAFDPGLSSNTFPPLPLKLRVLCSNAVATALAISEECAPERLDFPALAATVGLVADENDTPVSLRPWNSAMLLELDLAELSMPLG